VITLYGPRDAPFTEKVVRGLTLKGLAFELTEPESPEDYRRWNPETGLLPLLDIHGERVHDSTDILLRLEALYPDPPLLSSEPRTRAAQLNLESWADESFLWYWLRWQRLAQSPGPNPTQNEPTSDGERSGGLRSWLPGRREPPPSSPAHDLLREVDQRLADLTRLLAGRAFFYSDRPSVADLAVSAMLRSLSRDNIPGGAVLLRRHPDLVAYLDRLEKAS